MSDRRSSHHHHHHQRQSFEEKYRTLENELKRKNQAIESLRNDFIDTSQHQNDLSRSSMEQSVSDISSRINNTPSSFSSFKFIRNGSQRSSINSNWHSLVRIFFIIQSRDFLVFFLDKRS